MLVGFLCFFSQSSFCFSPVLVVADDRVSFSCPSTKFDFQPTPKSPRASLCAYIGLKLPRLKRGLIIESDHLCALPSSAPMKQRSLGFHCPCWIFDWSMQCDTSRFIPGVPLSISARIVAQHSFLTGCDDSPFARPLCVRRMRP